MLHKFFVFRVDLDPFSEESQIKFGSVVPPENVDVSEKLIKKLQ